PGRTGSSTARTPQGPTVRYASTAPGSAPTSTESESDPRDHGTRLQREDSQQRRAARRPPAPAGAGVLAAQLPELVGVHGPGAAHPGRLPAYRDQRGARGLGPLRARADEGLPVGHLPGRAEPEAGDRVRPAQGRARLAEGTRRVPGRPAAAD